MVVLGAEERLVDCTSDKGSHVTVISIDAEHVVEGIGFGLEPELVVCLNAARDTVHGGLACAMDEKLILGVLDGTRRALDFSSEETVPGGVTAIHSIGVWGDVGLVKIPTAVSFKACEAERPKPAVNFVGQGVVRVVGHEVIAPIVQHLLQLFVERGHAKQNMTCICVAEEVEQEIHWNTDGFSLRARCYLEFGAETMMSSIKFNNSSKLAIY